MRTEELLERWGAEVELFEHWADRPPEARRRLLADQPTTLEQLGADHGVSRERARQIEERLKKKLRLFLEAELGDSLGDVPGPDKPK